MGQAPEGLGIAKVVNRRVRELPVAISEHAFFVKSSCLREGFNLLKEHASYKRDYLMPRLKSDGGLEPKPACYADAMVATGELSSECIALENSKFAFKAPEIRSGLENLKSFVDDLRKTQVLLDRKLSSMDEAACKAEKADIEQWNRNANEHLDNVKLLLKKVKGWLA